MSHKLRFFIFAFQVIVLAYCPSLQAQNTWHCTRADPYENFNRQMYQFNKGLDTVFFRPVAFLYKKIVPCPVTKMVNNFFNNVGELVTIPNDVLQGNLYHASTDTTRFFINTTFGIGGLFDVASCGGLPRHVEDTGLTFAKWGYRSSSYLVLPILGPSTVRDTLGMPFDYYLFSPYPYIPYTRSIEARIALAGLYGVDRRSQLLDFDETIRQASVDPYVFIRDAYLQRRNFLIATNDDRSNNLNIQNENTTPVSTDSTDVYVPGDENDNAGNSASDDPYVPDETANKTDEKETATAEKNKTEKTSPLVLND